MKIRKIRYPVPVSKSAFGSYPTDGCERIGKAKIQNCVRDNFDPKVCWRESIERMKDKERTGTR